jgi:hypothetical protein
VSRWSSRLASRLLLALALLVLQQGALTHALSHPHEPGKPHGTKQCELCHAFAAADTEAAPPVAVTVASPEAASPTTRFRPSACHARRFLAFASRAPPACS